MLLKKILLNMSIFKSKTNKKNRTSVPEAIQKLRETELLLQKKQEFLEAKIENENTAAKQYAKTNKTLALQALRRKKRFESYLQQLDGTLSTIEMQRETLEISHTDQLIMESLTLAADALKMANKKVNVDEVHNIMDDIAEERDRAQEISDAISKPVGFTTVEVDEDDLMKELEEMEQEEVDRKLLDVQLPSTSQDVPVSVMEKRKVKEKVRDEDEDDELAAMSQWAS